MIRLRKIISIFLIICSMVIFSGCTISVDTSTPQTSKITLSDHTLSDNTLKELSTAGFTLEGKSVSTTISLYSFNKEFKKQFELFESIVSKEKELSKFEVNGSFVGFPFSGVSTIVLSSDTSEDVTINIKSNDVIIDDGEILKEATINTKNLNDAVSIKQYSNSINKVINTISVEDKKVFSEWTVYSDPSILNKIPTDTYLMDGFKSLERGNGSLKISREYESTIEFNKMFNLENAKLFNVISNLEIKSTAGMFNSFDVKGTFYENSSPYTLVVNSNYEATHNGEIESANKYSWEAAPGVSVDFKSSSISWGTITILLLVLSSIVGVILALIKVQDIKRKM